MQAEAAVAERSGEEETRPREGNEDQVVTVLVQILGSDDPKTALLGAIMDGTIPDETCLELAENLGELVKAVNFDNRIEVAFALHESGAISEKTQEVLLLAILEMDEQEEVSDFTEIRMTTIQAPTPELPASAPQAPPTNLIADLIRSAAELQAQFGKNLPEDKLSEIRQAVGRLTEEGFGSLRQILGSVILAQAEIPADQRRTDVAASLQVVEILLGQRQAELTAAAFAAYEILTSEGFRLNHRNEFDRPLMTVSSITLLRNRFQRWLDSRESGPPNQSLWDATGQVGESELASAHKTVTTLEGFLLAAADDFTKTAIQRDRATRLRERIISSQIRILDAVSNELVASQPRRKWMAIRRVKRDLETKRKELASKLQTAGLAILSEAEATIWQVLDLRSATAALRQEIAELEDGNYDRLSQRPMLSDRDKRLAVYELERKELYSIRLELEAAQEEGTEINRNWKKLQILSAITAGKLQELDQLIAGLRPAPELDPVKLALPVTGQGVRHG